MTHRPYPNVDRALRQLNRHARTVEVPEWRVKMAADARRALAVAEDALQPMSQALRGFKADAQPVVTVKG